MIHWAWLIPVFFLGMLVSFLVIVHFALKEAGGLLSWLSPKEKK